MNTPRYPACATVVTSADYVIGAMVLGHSLRKSGWKHDMVVLATEEVGADDRARLRQIWDDVLETEHVSNPNSADELGLRAFATCYTKLRIWELTQYDQVIYLDADTIVLGSLEPLLERTCFAAAPCPSAPDLFNTAVMVVQPSAAEFREMVSLIRFLPSYDGGDQGFLNSYFADWFTGPAEARLPYQYNTARLSCFYKPSWTRFTSDMRVLHYFGPAKPWSFKCRIAQFLMRLVSPSGLPSPSPLDLWKGMLRDLEAHLRTAAPARVIAEPQRTRKAA